MSHMVAIILGFIEGATEFIPISSSGHLIIARALLGENNINGLAYDAVLQLSATLALLLYFLKDIFSLLFSKNRTLLYAIVLGTIPAIIFGLLLEKEMESIFRNVKLVALTLICGSILMWYAEKVSKSDKVLTIKRGIIIGFYQCLALIPGISRSGATISGGLISGLSKEEAVRFSFLLSLPILLGAGLKKLLEVRHDLFGTGYGSSLLLGSMVAFVTGFISINFLIKYLRNHSLNLFIWYRIGLSIAIFLLFKI